MLFKFDGTNICFTIVDFEQYFVDLKGFSKGF